MIYIPRPKHLGTFELLRRSVSTKLRIRDTYASTCRTPQDVEPQQKARLSIDTSVDRYFRAFQWRVDGVRRGLLLQLKRLNSSSGGYPFTIDMVRYRARTE